MNSGNGGGIIQESGSESMEDRDKADLERIEEFRTAKEKDWPDWGIAESTSMNDNPNGVMHMAKKPVKVVKKSKGTKAKELRKIAIIGTAESQQEAPYKDESWEIWGLQVSLSYPTFTRYNRLYELHIKDYWHTPIVLERLKKVPENIDVWMQQKYKEIPQSKEYPLEEIVKGFHENFTSSIAYMLAHAVLEQKKLKNIGELELFGVHMMADEEYGYQRPACEYWLGILEAFGVKVNVRGSGAVLKCTYRYGYDKEWKLVSDLSNRKRQLNVGLADLERKLGEIRSHFNEQKGAIKDVDWTIRRIQ